MRKFAMTTIATAALLVGGLTGCGADDQAGDMGAGTFRGVGTNDGYTITNRGTTGATYTGEGPITDMFTNDDRPGIRRSANEDRTLRRNTLNGNRMTTQNKQLNKNDLRAAGNRSSQNIRMRDDNGFYGQNRQGTGVLNRGDLNRETGLFGTNGQVTGDRGGRDIANPQIADNDGANRRGPLRKLEDLNTGEIERIVERMDNVNEAHVVSHGNSVVIGVDTDGKNRESLENNIKQRVQQIAGNRDVYVVTDRDQLGRIRTMGERMREGGSEAIEEIGATFNEMINDLGRAAKRPFERSR